MTCPEICLKYGYTYNLIAIGDCTDDRRQTEIVPKMTPRDSRTLKRDWSAKNPTYLTNHIFCPYFVDEKIRQSA